MTRHRQQWTVYDGIAIDRTAGGAHGVTGAALLDHAAHARSLPGCGLDGLLPEFFINWGSDLRSRYTTPICQIYSLLNLYIKWIYNLAKGQLYYKIRLLSPQSR